MHYKAGELLKNTSHRPWPLPKTPWIMSQAWENLLFAHWPVPAEMLTPHLPEGVTLDTFEGQAWLGVVPFKMQCRLRANPWSWRFDELNVRTYVTVQGKPGVFFFSLDANDLFTVVAARLAYGLPYFPAKMHTEQTDTEYGPELTYTSQRKSNVSEPDLGLFTARYRPVSPVFYAKENTLEHWLTERYCLYATSKVGLKTGTLYRGNIHHAPWPLQHAEASFEVNTVAEADGLQLPCSAPILHYAHHLDVLIWGRESVTISE